MYTPNRLNYHLLEKDIINFLNEVGEEFFKYYDVRNLVEDFVYVYNCDIDDMEKELRQLKIFPDKSKEKEFTKCREAVEKIYEIKNSV